MAAKIVHELKGDSIGTDAEFFIVDKEGKARSSIGIISGEKDKPTICAGGGYLSDCVAVEINPTPVLIKDGPRAFINNILDCMGEVDTLLNKLDLSISIEPEKLFEPDQLAHPMASISGCSPSYDIWTMSKVGPVDLTANDVRFAGGDIHVGWNYQSYEERVAMVRLLDIIFGANEVLFYPQSLRSMGYGRSGICRPTDYGIEYKSISNFWLRSPLLMEWVWKVVKWALVQVKGTCRDRIEDARKSGENYEPFIQYQSAMQRMKEAHHMSTAENIVVNFDTAPLYPVELLPNMPKTATASRTKRLSAIRSHIKKKRGTKREQSDELKWMREYLTTQIRPADFTINTTGGTTLE